MLGRHPKACCSFLIFSTISMWPLLLKDGLISATFSCCAVFLSVAWFAFRDENCSASRQRFYPLVLLAFAGACQLAPCCLSAVVSPPPRYPDLFAVIISSVSCGYFLIFTLYWHLVQFGYVSQTSNSS